MSIVHTARARLSRRSWISPVGALGVGLVALVVIVTILAPLLTTHSPNTQDLGSTLASPGTSGHLLGTDALGRDLFSRVLYGGRTALAVVTIGVLFGTVFGVALGLLSGLRGRLFDQVTGRLADIQLSIPVILLAIALLAFSGTNVSNLAVVIALAVWPMQFRVTRAQAASLRRMAFVEAVAMGGARQFSVVYRHLLPNVLPTVIVTATSGYAAGLVLESGLSYMGLGVQPPTPDWGSMISAGQTELGDAWWLALAPGAALLLLLLGIQLTGDWLAVRLSVEGRTRIGR